MNFKKQRPDPPFFFEKEQVIPLLRLMIGISVAFGLERSGKLPDEEKLSGQCGHERGRYPHVRSVPQGCPKGKSLPLHAPSKGTIASSDDPVRLEEQPGADGVGSAGHEGCAALETGNRILLDGERMKQGTGAIGLFLPFFDGFEPVSYTHLR